MKRPGSVVDHPLCAEVKERVKLHIFSTSGPSWTVLWRTVPLSVQTNKSVCQPIRICIYALNLFKTEIKVRYTKPWLSSRDVRTSTEILTTVQCLLNDAALNAISNWPTENNCTPKDSQLKATVRKRNDGYAYSQTAIWRHCLFAAIRGDISKMSINGSTA